MSGGEVTRRKLKRTLRWSYAALGLVLVISLVAKLAGHIPGVAGTRLETIAKDVYEFLKDMSLVFITVVAAYLASIFQRRQTFVASLKEEWHEIVRAKSALYAYTQLANPTVADYLGAFCALSETIDNMRTVYRNVGETDTQIGLYPFAPLHDMRRALQTLDPSKVSGANADDRRLVRDAILQSFYALRERFLEELEPEVPDSPLLIFGGRRLKGPGFPDAARKELEAQRSRHDRLAPADPRIQAFLEALYDKEQGTAKPWRQVNGGASRSESDNGAGAMT